MKLSSVYVLSRAMLATMTRLSRHLLGFRMNKSVIILYQKICCIVKLVYIGRYLISGLSWSE